MKLPIPPEPKRTELDNWAKCYSKSFGRKMGWNELTEEMKEATIRQMSGPASYLWENWKGKLKQSISWQNFMNLCSKKERSFLSWAKRDKSWEEVIKSLCKLLDELIEHK